MSKEKTIVFGVFHGFAARYLLQTGILLRVRQNGARVIILASNDGAYLDPFRELSGITVTLIPDLACERYYSGSRLQWLFKQVRFYIYGKEVTTGRIYREFWWRDLKHSIDSGNLKVKVGLLARYYLVVSIASVLRKLRILRKAWLSLESRMFCPSVYEGFFDEEKPDMVVVASIGNFDWDQYLMRSATRRGIKVVSVIMSWDNTSTRGYTGAPVDKVVAWTEVMKRELIEYHDIADDKIYVGGVPLFDSYYKQQVVQSREKFISSVGADPAKNILFFATRSPNSYPWNPNIAKVILEAISDGRLNGCQLLLRIHPLHYRKVNGKMIFESAIQAYDALAKEHKNNLVLNVPDLASTAMNYAMPTSELDILEGLMRYSDIVITVLSTMNIEGAIFDKPLVNACFEGDSSMYDVKEKARYDIRADLTLTHLQRLIDIGGMRLSYNPAQLIEHIQEYIDNPQCDADARRRIVEQEVGPHRGYSARIIGDYIAAL